MSLPHGGWWRPPASAVPRQTPRFLLVLVVVMVLAVVLRGSGERPAPVAAVPPQAQALADLRTLPGSPAAEPPPQVEAVDGNDARRLNEAVPFAPTAGVPARPFRSAGSLDDQARAMDCLAIAAMAEAGGDDIGQRAVIQVVLNRARHPAFPKTICGVVFQGSHRASGCQFTFTCDGALARRYSAASWTAARNRAAEALAGSVHAPVGLATHYHTDWVHPYWSDSLVKLARVDTHLFFRWSGSWGSAAAFSTSYRGGEPVIMQLAYLPSHRSEAGGPVGPLLAEQATVDPALRDVVVRNGDGGAFVLLASASSAASAREVGRDICLDGPSCKVFGWFDRSHIPAGYPVPSSARAQLGFSYYRDAQGGEIVLYDCAQFTGVVSDNCMPRALIRRGATGAGPAAAPLALAPSRAGAETSAAEGPVPPQVGRGA